MHIICSWCVYVKYIPVCVVKYQPSPMHLYNPLADCLVIIKDIKNTNYGGGRGFKFKLLRVTTQQPVKSIPQSLSLSGARLMCVA